MHGLYLLWWVQEKHMSPAFVAAALAAGDLALMLLEVPTGWFADRRGHRCSLIVGSVVQVLGMLCCWLGHGAPGLIAASLLVALGDGFRSGADHALLYRTCAALGRDREFQAIEARTQAIRLVSMVGLVLAGGAIVHRWGFAAGWIAETALCFAGVVLACAMCEPSVMQPQRTQRSGSSAPSPSSAVGIPLGVLLALTWPTTFLGAVASAASFFAQTTGHGEAGTMTLLVAFVTLAEAAGSTLAMRLNTTGPGAQRALAGLGAAILTVAAIVPSAFMPAVIALAFLLGVAHPLRAAAIQRAVPDGVRARAASIASACDMAFMVIALPAAGVWQTRRRR